MIYKNYVTLIVVIILAVVIVACRQDIETTTYEVLEVPEVEDMALMRQCLVDGLKVWNQSVPWSNRCKRPKGYAVKIAMALYWSRTMERLGENDGE